MGGSQGRIALQRSSELPRFMSSHGKAFREAFGLVGREHVAVGKLSFGCSALGVG